MWVLKFWFEYLANYICCQAFEQEVSRGGEAVTAFFGLYLPSICSDLGLGDPDDPSTVDAAHFGRSPICFFCF
jgi:hypothetical protein